MGAHQKLPGDYALDALAQEVDRRAKQRGDPSYSYGKLIAQTTPEERERIADTYRAEYRKKRGRGGTRSFFQEAESTGAGE